jgi:hypothetical protein
MPIPNVRVERTFRVLALGENQNKNYFLVLPIKLALNGRSGKIQALNA